MAKTISLWTIKGCGRGRLVLRSVLPVAVAAVLASAVAGASWGSDTAARPTERVIVLAQPGQESQVAAQIRAVGGTVGLRLRIVHGFSATLPPKSLVRLRKLPGVRSVTPDARLRASSADYDPASDTGSTANLAVFTGAKAWWAAGFTGRGVDVAVIDSGVSPVEGLTGSGKVVHGPDLSLESQAPNLTRLDTYGHGTFMAGLIAGRDDGLQWPYTSAPATAYRGMAPDARIVSVKVATADGGTDVSQVIAAIDWVVQHRRSGDLNIRVLNLSYGTNSTQSYVVDPLAFAAEQAWKRGIVVVSAAGNTGYQRRADAPGLANPAYDPFVIATGASVPTGQYASSEDDVAPYSAGARCWYCRRPDFVAPGHKVQGLRVASSYLDEQHPEGRLGERFFRGSGTSQAAAITSGAVALVLDRYPTLSPDRVKRFFTDNAVTLDGFPGTAQGDGEMRLRRMLSDSPSWYASQDHASARGGGSLELARGQDHIERDGVVLTGEQDIFGKKVDTAALANLQAAGSSWSGGTWNGSSWSGSSWSGSSWSGSSWSGSSWSGSSWSGSSWSGSSWSGSSWSGSSWSGSSWSSGGWG